MEENKQKTQHHCVYSLLAAFVGSSVIVMAAGLLPFYSHALIHVLIYNNYNGVES
jgi:hypothetical protein